MSHTSEPTLYEKLTDTAYIEQQQNKPLKSMTSPQEESRESCDSEEIVINWLAQLNVLHFVPFNYLVADEQMLPLESIRFFQVDGNWLHYLQDGACSVARSTPSQHAHDKVAMHNIKHEVKQRLHQFRYRHSQPLLNAASTKIASTSQQTATSGFLLRSHVVAGWPGLEVLAFNAPKESEQTRLAVRRMEKLSDNVLLCLFAGVIDHVVLREPSEGTHFGIEIALDPADNTDKYQKALRYIDPVEGHATGDRHPTKPVQSPLPPDNERALGVLPINQLAQSMQHSLGKKQPLNAAEWALEMVQGAQSVRFTRAAT